MTPTLYFDAPGVYTPRVEAGCPKVIWARDTTGDPFVGVQVNSPEHASQFANVFVQDGDTVRRVPRKEK